jgi:hypothetical protein
MQMKKPPSLETVVFKPTFPNYIIVWKFPIKSFESKVTYMPRQYAPDFGRKKYERDLLKNAYNVEFDVDEMDRQDPLRLAPAPTHSIAQQRRPKKTHYVDENGVSWGSSTQKKAVWRLANDFAAKVALTTQGNYNYGSSSEEDYMIKPVRGKSRCETNVSVSTRDSSGSEDDKTTSEMFAPFALKQPLPQIFRNAKGNSATNPIRDNVPPHLDPNHVPLRPLVALSTLLRNRKVRVPDIESAVKHFCECDVRSDIALPNENNNFNNNIKSGCDHPISSVYRELAFLFILKRSIQDGKKTTILDWFGNVRNEFYIQHPDLEIVCAPTTAVQGDNSRQFRRKPLPPVFDTFLVQDVYQEGYDCKAPLSSKTLLDLCEKSVRGTGYVVCRYFPGVVGQDSVDYNEGFWIRENGLILFSPGKTGVGYARHPDVNWLFETRSKDGLSITDLAQFGPYKIFSVAKDAEMAIEIDDNPIKTINGEIDYLTEKTVSPWFKSLESFLPYEFLPKSEESYLVHMPTFAHKNALFRGKVISGILVDSARGMVENSMRESNLCQELSRRFPRFYNEVVESTAKAILYYGRERETRSFSYILDKLDFSERLLFTNRVKKPSVLEQEVPTVKKFLFKTLGTLTSFYLLFKLGKMGCSKFLTIFGNFANKIILMLSSLKRGSLRPFSLEDNINGMYDQLPKDLEVDSWFQNNGFTKLQLFVIRTSLNLGAIYGCAFMEEFLRMEATDCSVLFNWIGETATKLFIFGPKLAILNLIFHVGMHITAKMGLSNFWRTLFHGTFNMIAMSNPIAVSNGPNPRQMNLMSFLPLIFAFLTGGVNPKTQEKVRSENLSHIKENRTMFTKMEEVESIFELPKGAFLPASTGKVMPRVDIRDSVLRTEVFSLNDQVILSNDLKESIIELSRKEEKDIRKGIYPILSPLNLMYRPDSSLINLYNAVVSRILIDPHKDFNKTIFKEAWKVCLSGMQNIYRMFSFDIEMTLEEAISKMDSQKKRRMLRAEERNLFYGDKIKFAKSISVKHDEIIAAKVINGEANLKPRAIVQYPPEMLQLQIATAHSLSVKLHEIFNEDMIYEVEISNGLKVRISFIFASGYTDLMLNEVFSLMLSDPERIFYIVAGDDTFIQWGVLGKFYGRWCETDFTQYDQTHQKYAFKYHTKMMTVLGLGEEYNKRNIDACSQKFIIYHNFKEFVFKWFFSADWQLGTGLADTTNINSANNIAHGFYQTVMSSISNDMILNARHLGYKLKMRVHDDPSKATFLKGWWMKTNTNEFKWLPLPSAVLKLGKVLEDPCTIAKDSDIDNAMRKCMFALARSLGYIPYEYPILGPFIKLMLEKGIETDLVIKRRFKKIEVSYFDSLLDRDFVLGAIESRYGISEDMVSDFESILKDVNYFPVMINHPVFDLLMFDYE